MAIIDDRANALAVEVGDKVIARQTLTLDCIDMPCMHAVGPGTRQLNAVDICEDLLVAACQPMPARQSSLHPFDLRQQ
jgi:hypothetical protein